jgi:hypothetical protein
MDDSHFSERFQNGMGLGFVDLSIVTRESKFRH